MTIFGGLLAVVGIVLFQLEYDWSAIAVLTASFITDAVDGVLARYLQGNKPLLTLEEEKKMSWWELVNYPGITRFGSSLDPIVDKVRYIGLLWTIGYDLVDFDIAVSTTVIAVLLTLMRPIKVMLKLENIGANTWGKHKMHAEVVATTIIVFGTRELFSGDNPLAHLEITHFTINLSASLAMILGAMSLYKHLENGYTSYVLSRR